MNTIQDANQAVWVGKTNFEAEVLASRIPVLVLFWTPRSGPCRAIEQALKELVSASARAIKVAIINSDVNSELTLWYGVPIVPTLLYFIDGIVRARSDGTNSDRPILNNLESWIRDCHAASFSKSSSEN